MTGHSFNGLFLRCWLAALWGPSKLEPLPLNGGVVDKHILAAVNFGKSKEI